MFQRILVALKFSPAGRRALETGVRLARETGARLAVFHGLDYRLLRPQTSEETILAMTREAESLFEQHYKPLLENYPLTAFNCWEAEPVMEICKLAEEMRADLIVIGCHQAKKGKAVTRLGSIGLGILECAPCPVLVVPCP